MFRRDKDDPVGSELSDQDHLSADSWTMLERDRNFDEMQSQKEEPVRDKLSEIEKFKYLKKLNNS